MARWSWLILAFYIVLAVSAQDSTVTSKPANSEKASGQNVTPGADASVVKNVTVAAETTPKATKTTVSTKSTEKTSTEIITDTPADTTTTAAPTTAPPTTQTTTAAPTTAAPPVPKWPNNIGNWTIEDATKPNQNVSCLILLAAFEVNVKYNKEKNTTAIANVLVPPSAKLSGTCKDNVIEATLTWTESIVNKTESNNLTLKFTTLNVTEGKESYGLTEITLSVYCNENETRVEGKSSDLTLFLTPLTQSYKCSKDTPVKISGDIELRVSHLQVEAFRTTPFDKFSAELECSGDDVSAVVPFAVGASLALLVVIVLIAYLIGRRRSRARGYQSV